LVYREFVDTPTKAFHTAFASGQAENEVRFEILDDISKLRKCTDKDNYNQILGEIRAKVMMSEATGWITAQTSEKIQDLIAKMFMDE
jgi:hypothetical protein